jgi:hypothetical protein
VRRFITVGLLAPPDSLKNLLMLIFVSCAGKLGFRLIEDLETVTEAGSS